MCCKPAASKACGISTATSAGSRKRQIGYSRLWRRRYQKNAWPPRRPSCNARPLRRPCPRTIRWKYRSTKKWISMNWRNGSSSGRGDRRNSATFRVDSVLGRDDAHHAAGCGIALYAESQCRKFDHQPRRGEPKLGVTADRLMPAAMLFFVQQIVNHDLMLLILEKAGQDSRLRGADQDETLVPFQFRSRVVAKRRREHPGAR